MNPRYEHEFLPSKRRLCKQVVGGQICGKDEQAVEHVRWTERMRDAPAEAELK